MTNFIIRPAIESDIPHILAMIREFAEFLSLSDYCEATEERLQIALFSDAAIAEAIVAVENELIIGYAIFFPYFASFRGQRGFFLEDIYLKPEMRGRKLGEKMLRYIAKLAKSRGYERIDFEVARANSNAINFYKKLGAVVDESVNIFKFTDEAFLKIAL